jgi:hypothetical protein
MPSPSPLYDVALISSTGEVWTLAGYERIASGALVHEYTLARPNASGSWSHPNAGRRRR